jgi:Protein of unknown function (DUF4013)
MQVGKSFTYAFEDREWLSKLLIGALLFIIPFLNIVWGGYTTEIIRRVSRNDPEPLAGWDDFGKKFVDGLILLAAGLIYSLPIIILVIIAIPVFWLPSTAQGNSQNALAAVGTGFAVLLGCVIFLYGLLLSVLYPAVQVNFARNGTFGSCFQIGNIIKLATSNLGNFVLAWLAYIVVGFVVGLVVGGISTILSIIPCVGWILALIITAVATPYTLIVYSHLFGQVGAQAPAA